MTDLPDGFRLDAAALKVLAHPLRSRLLSALRRGGPSTATDLARQLTTNTGATSYHLRRLESVGLVADTGEGAGRRRLWRAATRSHQWTTSDFVGDEDAETALAWLVRDYVHDLTRRFERWLDVEETWPAAWRDVAGLSDYLVHVTPEQGEALKDELDDVLVRYRDAGAGHPDAQRMSVYAVLMPMEPDAPAPAVPGTVAPPARPVPPPATTGAS